MMAVVQPNCGDPGAAGVSGMVVVGPPPPQAMAVEAPQPQPSLPFGGVSRTEAEQRDLPVAAAAAAADFGGRHPVLHPSAPSMAAPPHSVARRVAPLESWTDEEVKSLERSVREFPPESHSLPTVCAKAAARLPNKTIRDVCARLRVHTPLDTDDEARARGVKTRGSDAAFIDDPNNNTSCSHMSEEAHFEDASQGDDVSRRIEVLLRANVDLISRMRDNLHRIDLLDNIPLMRDFDSNVAQAFALLRRLEAKMPPFPVRVNTMYLSGAQASSNDGVDAFDRDNNDDGALNNAAAAAANVPVQPGVFVSSQHSGAGTTGGGVYAGPHFAAASGGVGGVVAATPGGAVAAPHLPPATASGGDDHHHPGHVLPHHPSPPPHPGHAVAPPPPH